MWDNLRRNYRVSLTENIRIKFVTFEYDKAWLSLWDWVIHDCLHLTDIETQKYYKKDAKQIFKENVR